jgi:Spy/CpxP family protein refolding chaperone
VLVLCAPLAFGGVRDRASAGCNSESADARMARQLGLSDEQVTKVHELRTAFLREQLQLQQTFSATRAQLQTAKQAGDAERQQQLRAMLRSMRRELRTRQADLEQKIAGVLTDEQRARWEATKPKRRERNVR